MLCLKILAIILGGIDLVINFLLLILLTKNVVALQVIPEFFNPVIIYRNNNVNYFGSLMVMLFYHILLLPFAVAYWMYMIGRLFVKLCTIGRR